MTDTQQEQKPQEEQKPQVPQVPQVPHPKADIMLDINFEKFMHELATGVLILDCKCKDVYKVTGCPISTCIESIEETLSLDDDTFNDKMVESLKEHFDCDLSVGWVKHESTGIYYTKYDDGTFRVLVFCIDEAAKGEDPVFVGYSDAIADYEYICLMDK